MNALIVNFLLLPTKLSQQYLSAQPDLCSAPRATRSSSVVTLSRPPTSFSLRITNRSFRYASPHLWNQLPVSFRQPCINHSPVTLSNSSSTCSPLSTSIAHSLFHSRLKTHLFHKSLPPTAIAPTGLPSRTILDWTHSTQRFSFFTYFSLLFFILRRTVD